MRVKGVINDYKNPSIKLWFSEHQANLFNSKLFRRTKSVLFAFVQRLIVCCVFVLYVYLCCSVCWFLHWPFCHGALKPDISTLFTTFLLFNEYYVFEPCAVVTTLVVLGMSLKLNYFYCHTKCDIDKSAAFVAGTIWTEIIIKYKKCKLHFLMVMLMSCVQKGNVTQYIKEKAEYSLIWKYRTKHLKVKCR